MLINLLAIRAIVHYQKAENKEMGKKVTVTETKPYIFWRTIFLDRA